MKLTLCNCSAPVEVEKGFCSNCGWLLSDDVSLNIDDIPEELYMGILAEFRKTYGDMFHFIEWRIEATIQ